MKKMLCCIVFVLVILMTSVLFSGCGEKHTCVECGKETRDCEQMLGQWVCEDCRDEIQDALKDLGDLVG